MKTKKWTTAPISPTCEKLRRGGVFFAKAEMSGACCDLPTAFAYPAMGGGWMALCYRHGFPHLPQIAPIEELIASGETFEGNSLPPAAGIS